MKARALLLMLIALVMVGSAMGQLNPDTLWTRSYGGEGDDWANVVRTRGEGGYLVAGVSQSFDSTGYNMLLLLVDENGNTEHAYTYGADRNDAAENLISMSDGGVTLLGYNSAPMNYWTDGYIVRTDANGDTLWTQTYDAGQCEWAVSGYEDDAYNIIVLCSSSDEFMSAYRNSSVWRLTYSPDGELLDATGYPSPAWTRSIVLDADVLPNGGFLRAGQRWCDPLEIGVPSFAYGYIENSEVEEEPTEYHFWNSVISVRSVGEMGYIAIFEDITCAVVKGEMGAGESWITGIGNVPSSICAGAFNGYAATGYSVYNAQTSTNALLTKLDSTGAFMWSKQFGGADFDEGTDILMTEDNCYVIVGYTKSFGAGGKDIYIVKTGQDTSIVASVNRHLASPEAITLLGNFPNPFNPETEIEYQIASPSLTTLKVYDVLGREVASLVNEVKSAGNYTVRFDGSGLPSGVYIYRLQAGEFSQSRKMVLMK